MKRLWFIAVCLMVVIQSWAGPVTEDEARQKASKFMEGRVAARSRGSAPTARELKMIEAGPEDSYFIFNVGSNEGYVVVSGDDAAEDILGYSDTGSLDPKSIPCNMRMLFDMYTEQIKYIREKKITRKEIKRNRTRAGNDGVPETFLIDESRRSRFDQYEPYKDLCPIEDGDRTVTGCTATALAGLMYAYKWPNATIADIPSYWNGPFTRYNGTPKNTVIDWDNIVPQYGYYVRNTETNKLVYFQYGDDKISKAQKEAIATLMRISGTSIKSKYGLKETSGDSENIPKALIDHFDYDESVIFAKREDNQEHWEEYLRNEILNHGPVLYSGRDSKDGHAFLLEGWEGHYFYINFGWSGEGNNKLLLDLIGDGSESISFIHEQGAIFNVKPRDNDQIEVESIDLANANSEDYTIEGDYLHVTIKMHNLSSTNSTKEITISLTEQESGERQCKYLKPISAGGTTTYDLNFKELKAGNSYVLAVHYSTNDVFYNTVTLTCKAEPTFDPDDVIPGNENLTGYEYWFDDDFAGRVPVELNSNKAAIIAAVNTEGLADGMHRFNYRLVRSGNQYPYSSVSTSTFLKLTKEKEALMEYWLDDDDENPSTVPVENTEEEQFVELDLSNAPIGNHKLNYRISMPGAVKSNVYSQNVMKLVSGVADHLEYWFDDNIKGAKILDGKRSNTDDGYTYNSNIDLNGLSVGFHRLNMRAVSSNGQTKGSVLTYKVLKRPTGTATKLECWFDDDKKNLQILSGKLSENEYVYNNELNLEGLEPGHHRLYCRTISENGLTSGAISMTPVIIKSQYNKSYEDVKMSAFSIAVDDEIPVTIHVNESKDDLILNPYTLNVRDLNPGNHTLKAHFWNSANAGVVLEQGFKVNAIETPTIQLTAEEKDGQVTLKFNSIPNDVKWVIARYDANGVRAKVDGKDQGYYPSTITSFDSPSPGTYTYVARSKYIDASGTEHIVTSNEVQVSVTTPQSSSFGRIIGDVRVNRNTIWGERWKVTFSDEVELETDGYGHYLRDKVPVGKVLEISAKSRDYNSEPLTITVKEGENRVYHEGYYDEETVRSRYSNDLQFDSNVEFAPRLHMKFKVKNITRLPWHGKLRIVTARKEFVDNPPKNPFDLTDTQAQNLAGSIAPFYVNDYYQYDYSEEIWISPGESADVVIKHNVPITMPPTGKDEPYYFFVESQDEYGTKLVAINDDYNIKENPLVQLVDNGDYSSDEEDIETCVNVIMALCSTVVELDGKLGDLSKCMDEMQETLGYALDYDDLAGKIERCGSYSYIRDEIPEWKFYRILYNEDRRFLGMVNSVRDKISDEVRASKNALEYLKKVKLCLDAVKSYNQWQDMTDLERAGAIADKILDMSEKSFPFAKILKTYLDVTKKTIHNINGLAEKWDAVNNYATFYSGAELYHNDFIFDIKVKKSGWISGSFDAETVKGKILSAEIKCIGHIQGNRPLKCTAIYTPVVQDGKARLKRISINGDSTESGGEVPIEDMWMTIRWSNGRVSYVPIRSSDDMKGDGVKHDRNHYTITFQSKTNKEEYMADIIQLDD